MDRSQFLRSPSVLAERIHHEGGVIRTLEHDALLNLGEGLLRNRFGVLVVLHLERSFRFAIGVELFLPRLGLLFFCTLGLLGFSVSSPLSVVPRLECRLESLGVVVVIFELWLRTYRLLSWRLGGRQLLLKLAMLSL